MMKWWAYLQVRIIESPNATLLLPIFQDCDYKPYKYFTFSELRIPIL